MLLEESVIGWKEFEMEVVRDRKDNCIIVCSIENFDPMGVHTGDSITVAPAQTLTDKEYQRMRDASIAVLRKIGVDTGGSNVQFAVSPNDGRLLVIEMNPRVSRSSALASKATGFPIAKIAAKLAVGYTLDELKNDITGGATPASFEPSIDYVVTKIPRFTFEKFPAANDRLTTQMKSVGEVMAIGRTFQESLQKALRGLETGLDGFSPILHAAAHRRSPPTSSTTSCVRRAPNRILYVGGRVPRRLVARAHARAHEHRSVVPRADRGPRAEERQVAKGAASAFTAERLRALKRKGFSDSRLAKLTGVSEKAIRNTRRELGVVPVYKRVDTCAAEFSTSTAYMYSTYEEECEANPTNRRKIMILGGGPNRIGQGIEFDYCCVHAALALREDGFETIMVNCNPETVSTDYDTSDRLYFEPLTLEDVLEVLAKEKPEGVIVQFGGQTPLKLSRALEEAGAPIIGTTPGCHRRRRRPRALPAAREAARAQAAGECHGAQRGAGGAARTRSRLPARRAAVIRARRPRDGSRVHRRRPAHLHARRGAASRTTARCCSTVSSIVAIEVDVDAVCDGEDGAHRRHHGARGAGRRSLR